MTRRLRVRKNVEDDQDKMRIAEIRTEVNRQNQEIREAISRLESRQVEIISMVSLMETALINLGNTATLVASHQGVQSSRNAILELVNGMATDLQGYAAFAFEPTTNLPHSVEALHSRGQQSSTPLDTRDISSSIIRSVLSDADHPEDGEIEDEDEDIIANLSED